MQAVQYIGFAYSPSICIGELCCMEISLAVVAGDHLKVKPLTSECDERVQSRKQPFIPSSSSVTWPLEQLTSVDQWPLSRALTEVGMFWC